MTFTSNNNSPIAMARGKGERERERGTRHDVHIELKWIDDGEFRHARWLQGSEESERHGGKK